MIAPPSAVTVLGVLFGFYLRNHNRSYFQTVNDRVYRGGQPTDRGFRELAAAGVKTVVDLREDDERSKDEKRLVKALGMRYVNIPMKGMTTPSDKQISTA